MKLLSEGLVVPIELIKMPQSPSTEEDKTKEIKRRLKIRGIPEDDWQYYIESPHSWDYSKVASSGLSKGVEVVLLSPTTCTPSWVERGSLSRFIQLRGKLKELMQAKSEIEKFIQSKAPDDNRYLDQDSEQCWHPQTGMGKHNHSQNPEPCTIKHTPVCQEGSKA